MHWLTTFPRCRASEESTAVSEGGPPMTASLKAPGFVRAFAFLAIGVAVAFGLVTGIRALYGWDPLINDNGILIASLLGAPFFWLVGLGAFAYWFYWAAGKPT